MKSSSNTKRATLRSGPVGKLYPRGGGGVHLHGTAHGKNPPYGTVLAAVPSSWNAPPVIQSSAYGHNAFVTNQHVSVVGFGPKAQNMVLVTQPAAALLLDGVGYLIS